MKIIKLFRLMIVLLLAGQLILTRSSVQAEEMTCPEHTIVSIDIKPGGYPNTVNLSSRGLLAVAVLTTDNFDASLFIPDMAHLFDAASTDEACMNATDARWAREDVNDDGRPDLVFFFDMQSLDFTTSTTAATLMAHGSYGTDTLHIMGTDTVKIKG